jgi:hypothetical protein
VRGQSKKLATVAGLQASGQLHIPGNHDNPTDMDAEYDESLVALGLQVIDPDGKPQESDCNDSCYLWPCNVPTFNLWQQLQTQWRNGMSGREGLDYGGVTAYLRNVARIKPRKLRHTFDCIQAMERAALAAWAKK